MNSKESEIIDIIKTLRDYNKFSQDEIREKIGMKSLSSYNQKENKILRFRAIEILQIFDILDIKFYMCGELIDSNETLIKFLKSKREENGFTQDIIRQKIGLKSGVAYYQKENGKRPFFLYEVIELSEILNINISLKYSILQDNKRISTQVDF